MILIEFHDTDTRIRIHLFLSSSNNLAFLFPFSIYLTRPEQHNFKEIDPKLKFISFTKSYDDR